MVNRLFILFVIAIALASCGSFGYKYYIVSPTDDGKLEGKMLADEPKNDLDLHSKCMPDDVNKAKCVVLTNEEFTSLKLELETLRQQLIDCQRSCN